jgi:hypothetical protein
MFGTKIITAKVANIEHGSLNECQNERIGLDAPSRWTVCRHETLFQCIFS